MSKVLVLDGIQLVYDVSTFEKMNEQYDKLILVHKSNTPFNFSVSEVAQISQIIAQKKLEFFQVPNTFETESPKHDFNLALFYLLGYYDHPRHIQDQIAVNTLKQNLHENSFSWKRKNSDSAPQEKISNLNQAFGHTQSQKEIPTEEPIEPQISNAVNEFDQNIIVDDRTTVLVDKAENPPSVVKHTTQKPNYSKDHSEKSTVTNQEQAEQNKPDISKQIQQKYNDAPLNLFDQSDESIVLDIDTNFDIDGIDDDVLISPYDEKQPTYNIDKNKIIPNSSYKKHQQVINKHTVNPALSVFKETHTKEKFIQTLIQISENIISEKVSEPPEPILASDSEQLYDGIFKSYYDLYIVKNICAALISQKALSTTKSQLFSIINSKILENSYQEQNTDTIFEIMLQAGLLQNNDQPNININRSIAFFLISNTEPQIVNDTLVCYQTITNDQTYTDAIDFGYSISTNDSRIVSNLSLLIISKLDNNPNIFQPKEFRRIVGACFETIKIEELDYCYDLLKTRYKINPNDTYQDKNTAKLLRLSAVIRNTEEAKGITTTYLPPEQFNLTESVNINRIPNEPEQDFLQQQPFEETVSFQEIDRILNHENRDFLEQSLEENRKHFAKDEDTTNQSDVYFDHLKTVLESIQGKYATITHRDQLEKMMQRIFKKNNIQEDTANLYQKMVDDWIVKIIDYSNDNEHIALSPMAIFIALKSPNVDDYAFRVKKYKDVGVLNASVKVNRLESFKKALSSINRMNDDKRPKIIKGITTAINKKLDDEHETKMIIQSFADKKIHTINGKRVVFNQDAIDYWSIRTDTEKQPD